MASKAQDDPRSIVVSEMLTEQVEQLNAFWTLEAQAEAQPIGLELDDAAMAMLAEGDGEFAPEGEEVSEQAHGPEGAGSAAALAWDPQPRCPSVNSNIERVPNRAIIPYCPVGKLFMTFDNKRFVGSAWVIGEASVFTAGHCLYSHNDGGWADNVLFVPQYHQANEPVGRWAATQMASLKGWTAGGSDKYKHDLAIFKVDRPIRPRTGSLGWLANGPAPQGCITGIGYPAAAPFDGREMWRSTGKYLGGANPLKAYNDMTGGCSGGPWEIWRNGTPLTNGLNSHRYTSDPKTMYSPYFGNGFINLKNWAP